jgi:hypothetical protein
MRTNERVGLAQLAVAFGFAVAGVSLADAQSPTFAGNAQHTGLFSPPAQHLNLVRWTTALSLTNEGGYGHYGAPVITPSNTVIVPVRIASGYQLNAFDGATGRPKYTLATDYIVPAHNWLPAYQPALAAPPSGLRLYYPGAGGTLYYIENPDSDAPGDPVQQCFYTNLAAYSSNAAAFNASVFINTALTADSNGVVFFGFRGATNLAPAPLNTTNGGFVRLAPDGTGSYVLANVAAGNALAVKVPHNCAPTLSNDGLTLYVVARSYADSAYLGYLLGLDSSTLATQYKVLLRGPGNSQVLVDDDSTGSPVVGPDGDVYYGVYVNYSGWLLHFSGDLSRQMPPGAFGWDNTPAIVPASLVPAYTASSAYLLFSKYNNSSTGIHRVALLDPNATEIDPQSGRTVMREVLTAGGCTPATSPATVYSVHEWCINAAAVNPATHSVFMPNEDGRLYRWDLASNALIETLALEMAVSEGYVPTMIGPDGTVYALGFKTLFACGATTNVAVNLYSSAPDLRHTVVGQPVTFTASVTNPDTNGPTPSGTVTFSDLTYFNYVATNRVLAANVPLSNGVASVMATDLAATTNGFGTYLGSHFITAGYSGDGNFPTGSVTFVQKVHAGATVTSLSSWVPYSGTLSLTAQVAPQPMLTTLPTGLVTFRDGSTVLGPVPLNRGSVAFIYTNYTLGNHAFSATYASDTIYADSGGSLIGFPPHLSLYVDPLTQVALVSFTNYSGAPFTVLGASDPGWPLANWLPLGAPREVDPGQYQFLDPFTTLGANRYYRVSSP